MTQPTYVELMRILSPHFAKPVASASNAVVDNNTGEVADQHVHSNGETCLLCHIPMRREHGRWQCPSCWGVIED